MWSFRCKQGALSSATVIASKNFCKDKNNIFNIQIFFLSAREDSNPYSYQYRRFLQLIIPSTPYGTRSYLITDLVSVDLQLHTLTRILSYYLHPSCLRAPLPIWPPAVFISLCKYTNYFLYMQ